MTITQNHIAEFLALVTCVIFWKDIRSSKLRWLPFFLLFILLVELTGNYFRRIPYANMMLYNFTIPLEYGFYLFLFGLHGENTMKLFCRFAGLTLLTATLFYFITQPFKLFHNYVLLCGQALVIICCCIYFVDQFKKAEEKSLLHNYFFWLCSGLLLFNLGDLCYSLLIPVIKAGGWDKFDSLYKSINNNLLLLLYLSYIVSIIVFKKYSAAQDA